MQLEVHITEGIRADCKEAVPLIQGLEVENLLADRGYDTSEVISYAAFAGMNVVISPKRNRQEKRVYDQDIYGTQHLIENTFLKLKG